MVCELDVESEQDQAESHDEDLGEEELSPNDDEAPEDPEQDNDRDDQCAVPLFWGGGHKEGKMISDVSLIPNPTCHSSRCPE